MAKKQDTKAVESNVTQGTAFFDLGAYIAGVKSPDVAAQMASTYAFMLDVQIQKNARSILRTLTEGMKAYEGYESMKDIYSVLEEHEFLEAQMAQAGLSEDGPAATLKRLIALRPASVLLAQELVGMTFRWDGTPNTFVSKDLHEIFEDRPELKINKRTEQRIKLSVERHAEDASRDEIDAVVAKRMKREQEKLTDTANSMFDQRRALTAIVERVESGAGESSFHDLDVAVQRQLIMQVMSSAQRAEEFAAGNSNLTDAEFDSISFSVIAVCKQLRAVLQGAKFTVAERTAVAAI